MLAKVLVKYLIMTESFSPPCGVEKKRTIGIDNPMITCPALTLLMEAWAIEHEVFDIMPEVCQGLLADDQCADENGWPEMEEVDS